MVKGISRQVIVVHGPDQEIFEQAIFILKDKAVGEGITEEVLLKQAKRAIHSPEEPGRTTGPLWAVGGALATGLLWLLTALL
jgi:hypothetical protein